MRLIPTKKVGKRSPYLAQMREKVKTFLKKSQKIHSWVDFTRLGTLLSRFFKQKHNFYTKNRAPETRFNGLTPGSLAFLGTFSYRAF